MTEILQNLYYLLDDWVGQQVINDPEMKELLERQNVLQEEIIRCLGEDGQDTMEALFNLNLELKTIHGLRLGCASSVPSCIAVRNRALSWIFHPRSLLEM